MYIYDRFVSMVETQPPLIDFSIFASIFARHPWICTAGIAAGCAYGAAAWICGPPMKLPCTSGLGLIYCDGFAQTW